jgi:serine/threonine protein phosphatase PrpC
VALRIVEKAARSDVGRQRQGNEDSFLERSPLFAVADGMGGARAGEVASRIAVEQFDVEDGADDTPEEQLAEVARGANRKIHKMAQEDSAYAGMGTTFTAALMTGREIAIGHVGDSRLYRYRDDELERLTHDHSLVEEFVRQGKLTPAEAEVHPQRSIITRALGPEPEVEVDTYTHAGRDGDVYLLNSDGLTGMINEQKVAEILRDRESLEDAAEKLIAAANANGGKDNITVVLFRLGDGDEEDARDQGTLSGSETIHQGLTADDVQAAVTEQERAAARAPATDPAPPARKGMPTHARRSRGRRALSALVVLVALAAIGTGAYLGARSVYFLGTDDTGLVTLYRGVPYQLPLGIDLYSEHYASSVPARTISRSRRERLLDHEWRSKDDAQDLIRQLERGTLDTGSAR